MNTSEVQRLKMAWLAAKEAGDTQTQMQLLRENATDQQELIDFIAACHATSSIDREPAASDAALLTLTQRACQSALERVFPAQLAATTLGELRKSRQMSKVEVASGLRLGVDVWNKFEAGAIELASLGQRQVQRLADFFQISVEQFGMLLGQSQPGMTINRRQTREAADQEEQGPRRQSLADAIERSAMAREDKKWWLE